ncbi:MAG: sensor histidine kinase [Mangrovibacterium sp.]
MSLSTDYEKCSKEDLILELHDKQQTIDALQKQVKKAKSLKKIKSKLKRNQLRFKGLSKQSTEGILLVNRDGYIEFFNNAFCKLLDVCSEEIKHCHISEIYVALGNSLELFHKIITTKKIHHLEKERFLQQDGSCRYANVNGSLLRLPHEKLVLLTFNETTQEIEKQQELIKARQKAVEAERVKSIFLMNMSHEIRTPMNAILGFVDLLNDDISREERQSYIDVISQSGRRLLSTINDIIEVSRIESGKLEPRYEQINLIDFLAFNYNFLKPQAQAKNVDFHFDINISPEDALIVTDKKILDGICTNLIKNAIKFTNRGEIKFSCCLDGDFYKISISDTGQGISEKKQKLIFEQFSQADKDYLNRKHEGSGLGLTITRAYVESLGGRISLSSKPNEGSTFNVLLPYIKEIS